MKDNKKYMQEIIDLAKQAEAEDEVPVAAIIVQGANIIAKAHNLVESYQNPCMHAEVVAIEKACEIKGSKYLDDCDIYVNLEPCHMCAGAISHAKIKRLYFGAYDPKGGGVDHGGQVFNHTNHSPEVYGGIMEKECAELLKKFFTKKRLD